MNNHSHSAHPSRSRRSGLSGLLIAIVLLLYFSGRQYLQPSADAPSATPAPNAGVDVASDGSSSQKLGAESANEEAGSEDAESAPLGQLTDIGNDIQQSTAGLLYTPGSQEGHRLKHVLRHDNDMPSRPGKHGVFDGDATALLASLDEAYLLVKQRSGQVQSRNERGRTVHEIDMKRRVGFVGGQDGARDGNPPATHIRLVLEENRVITAFPY